MSLKAFRYLCHNYQTNRVLKFAKLNVLQQSWRNLHCNVILHRKMFLEHENQYAYGVMENKGYVKSFSEKLRTIDYSVVTKKEFDEILHENWSKKSPSHLLDAFLKLGLYSTKTNLCISNTIFDSYIDSLTDNLELATDEELQSLFYYIMQWPEPQSIRTRNFIEVWVAIDDECLKRLKRWSFDEMLNYVSLFYMLNVTKASDYCLKCLNKLSSKAKLLTPNQLVQTMFFIGIMRKAPFDMHNFEIHLDKHFESFSIDELAIMAMGFFKSKTPIRNMELISRISDKLIEQSKNINEVSLAALLKIIRYSKKSSSDDKIYKILDVLQHEVPRLSIMCNVHLALLGTATLTLHKECLFKIAIATMNTIDKTRMKDLERLILTFGMLNFMPNTLTSFFQKVVEELRKPERLPEIEKHGRSFACCVSFLGFLGLYPIDLMKKVLSPEFLENTYGKQIVTYGREVLVIHNSAKIFCPDADMHWLSDKQAILLAKKYTDFVPREDYKKQYNVSEKMILDIIRNLKEDRGGEDYVTGDHIVTHHQRGDIIVCNNHDGQPMEVKKYFNSVPFGTLHKVPDDNIWIALIVAGKNAIIQNSDTPTGPFQTKVTELKTLGFHAALILWSEYSSLESKNAKISYLNSLIKDAIHNNTKCEIKIM